MIVQKPDIVQHRVFRPAKFRQAEQFARPAGWSGKNAMRRPDSSCMRTIMAHNFPGSPGTE